nr:MAG TPA: hypothetical protein [Herelleviridae sp.]
MITLLYYLKNPRLSTKNPATTPAKYKPCSRWFDSGSQEA